MIEIIPNWHPIFVHFTVGLLSISVAFYVLSYLSKKIKFVMLSSIGQELEIAARWCLWAGAVITIATVLAGFYAYNTVKHDAPSHMAMTDHRNWAIVTAAVAILIAIWSLWRYYKQRPITITFILALLIMQGLLLSTAWRGGEAVYRYGLGVMDLPDSMEGPQMDGHDHGSEEIKNPNENTGMQPQPMNEESSPHTH
jgi:uncharacterized membrane protein